MAISFQETPSNYSLSGNPFRFSFSSNQTAQANFSYRLVVEVDGVEVENHKIFPTVSTYGYFDASDIAERYCKPIVPQDDDIYDAANYASIKITVYENYGTPPTDQLSTNTTIISYKGKLTKSNWLNFNPTTYVFASGAEWLTNYPTTRYIDLDVNNYFTFITNTNSLVLNVDLLDDTGATVASQSTSLLATTEITIYTISNTYLLAMGFTQNEIDSSSQVSLFLNDLAGDRSETITANIDRRCVRITGTNICFISSIGDLINYKFITNRVTTGNVKSIDYETAFGQLDEDGTFNYQRGGLQSKVKTYTEQIKVETDWLTEAEQQWLVRELSITPLVWLWLDSTNEWIRCRVRRSSYQYKQDLVDMNYRETFVLEIDNNTSTLT